MDTRRPSSGSMFREIGDARGHLESSIMLNSLILSMGPIIASLVRMVITKRTLILALLGTVVTGLLLRASLSDGQSASASELHITPTSCAAGAQDWLGHATWPTDEVLLGDQLYTRQEVWNLSHSEGNPVADLGLSLAAAQLNLAAGAKPSMEVVDALFEADLWLLDRHEEARRSQNESASLSELSAVLTEFNRWAATEAECSYSS